MPRPKNVRWIMCDQLRFDYLGCTGHPTLKTPNIDAMARRGVRFLNAYVQSPICGPSRMSFYTGRYMLDPIRYRNQDGITERHPKTKKARRPQGHRAGYSISEDYLRAHPSERRDAGNS